MDKLRKHIEEITPVSDQEFEYIKTFFSEKKVRKHQYLLQDGDMVTCEYWIAKGIFRAFYLDKEGKEYIVQFALENWWLSDYNAFFGQVPSNMNIVCMEEAEVYCLTLLSREKLASEMHKMEHFFRMKLTKGYSAQQRRICSLLSGSPKQRYEEFAKMYPGIVSKVPKKYIAEYLGVSRETLSRLYSGGNLQT
ncbi:Crp/Fnr family transcriptional regulator [Flavobacterium sp. MAH-1]|uniref:Crp/Fnr family transcriptional regulator n=1 Tax=Flavobacterium agri TaxID=2743471 RepID=A0A7Y8Y315_9FLAO|nr:Crp/Fnr family transcriptional regulator [Flavobacterium agri]NUY81660.1 Crp/Fnr family transcriptional regulator [Flavobacterium agri]NYA71684.1 Crp/Fnr family transcriptional regulator [Flavobacterium agri]